MPRLDNFLGFQIKPSKSQPFNPFMEEIHAEPNRNKDVVEMIARPLVAREGQRQSFENLLDASGEQKTFEKPQKTYDNILDTTEPHTSDDKVIPLFPMSRKSAEPIAAAAEQTNSVPMIQPRDKDGQRLLYRHPNLPRVGVKGGYWLLVGQSDRSQAAWLMQFDGAANPNPGPASSGAVLWSPPDLEGRRTPVFEMGKYLGKATNNIAEVQGLLLGLKIAAIRGARELLIEGDSELIIFQQTGKYRVSDKKLKVWWSEIQAAMMDETSFDWIAIRQVPREFNERADSITKEVLGRKEGFQR
jgi:ribonuclease HI